MRTDPCLDHELDDPDADGEDEPADPTSQPCALQNDATLDTDVAMNDELGSNHERAPPPIVAVNPQRLDLSKVRRSCLQPS